MEQYNRTNPVPIIIALIVGLIMGYLIGTFTADTEVGTAVQETGDRAGQNLEEMDFGNDENNTNSGSNLTEAEANETAFVIPVDRLSSAQQTAVRAAGIDGNEIVVTRGMVACAEAEVGAGRMVEIENGASLSMSEGITMIACYNAN